MIINVHAGHNPDGKTACGAIGYIQESTEARKVKNEVVSQLRQLGNTVYDCTCENGVSKGDVLAKIVKMCNSHKADLDVSIHFNALSGLRGSDGKTTGVECYIYRESDITKRYAQGVCEAVSRLGFTNRGVKVNQNLYVLKNTYAPAMLIECCFVDDKDDVELYNYLDMASAIVFGITGYKTTPKTESNAEAEQADAETKTGDSRAVYRVQVGAYGVKSNAESMQKRLKEAGFDAIVVKA